MPFGRFFAASRGGTVFRVLFFRVPTLTVSVLGLFDCCDVRLSLHNFQISVAILLTSQDVVHKRNFFAVSAFQHSRRPRLHGALYVPALFLALFATSGGRTNASAPIRSVATSAGRRLRLRYECRSRRGR